jgi:UTP--glucose-1-phosphate uridylyltransferase
MFDDFKSRFAVVPSLVACSSIIVKGDVLFDAPMTYTGDIVVKNDSERQKSVKDI